MESYVPAIVVWLCCWFSLPVFFPGSFALRALSASLCCCFFFGFKTMLPFVGCKLDCCLKLGIKEHGFQSLLGLLGLGEYGLLIICLNMHFFRLNCCIFLLSKAPHRWTLMRKQHPHRNSPWIPMKLPSTNKEASAIRQWNSTAQV